MDDIVIDVKVHPGARRTGVAGWHNGALKIELSAPAVDGKANDALVDFLAHQYGVRWRAVVIESGHTSRRKRVRIVAPVCDPHSATRPSGVEADR